MDFESLHSIPSPLWYSLLNAWIPAIIPWLLLPSKALTLHLILLCRHLFVCSALPLQLRGCHKSCHIWSWPCPWSQEIGSCGFLVKAGQWIPLLFPYCQGLMGYQQSSDLVKQTQKQAKLLVVSCLLCLSFPLLIHWEECLPGIPSLFSRYRVTFYCWSCGGFFLSAVLWPPSKQTTLMFVHLAHPATELPPEAILLRSLSSHAVRPLDLLHGSFLNMLLVHYFHHETLNFVGGKSCALCISVSSLTLPGTRLELCSENPSKTQK